MAFKGIGEFSLIEKIKIFNQKESGNPNKEVYLGIGDDCAIISAKNRNILITSDALVEDVHFKFSSKKRIPEFYALGIKAFASNISDIASMGGVPKYALITLGLGKGTTEEEVKNLYSGFYFLAKKEKIAIIGGDIVSSEKLFISITMVGDIANKKEVLRSGAKKSDLIAVTGAFGGPALKEFKLLSCLDFYKTTRVSFALGLSKTGSATSLIDSSDGLARSIHEICKSSKVGALVKSKWVPIYKGGTLEQALYGGEEYELVFTIPFDKYLSLPKKILSEITVIGEILDKGKGIKIESDNGKTVKMKGGYEHII